MSEEQMVIHEAPKSEPIPSYIEAFIKGGTSADEIAKLLDVHLRYERERQRLAYIDSMAKFRANAPAIIKSKKVEYANKDGSKTVYHHAELAEACEIITAELQKVGIRPSWKPREGENGRTVVTCVLTHELGHSEEVASLGGPPDNSGGKNSVQAIGSTTSYLQRYTLFAGTGIVPEGLDDDGKTSEGGMTEDAILDYSIQMQDATNFDSLKEIFREAFTRAATLKDLETQKRLTAVYNNRKKELRS